MFVCCGSSCLIKVMGPRSQAAVNEFSLRVHRHTTFTCAQTHTDAGNPRSELVNKYGALPGSCSQSPTVTSTGACRDLTLRNPLIRLACSNTRETRLGAQLWMLKLEVDCGTKRYLIPAPSLDKHGRNFLSPSRYLFMGLLLNE